jgi:hypothetical protein
MSKKPVYPHRTEQPAALDVQALTEKHKALVQAYFASKGQRNVDQAALRPSFGSFDPSSREPKNAPLAKAASSQVQRSTSFLKAVREAEILPSGAESSEPRTKKGRREAANEKAQLRSKSVREGKSDPRRRPVDLSRSFDELEVRTGPVSGEVTDVWQGTEGERDERARRYSAGQASQAGRASRARQRPVPREATLYISSV